MYIYPICFCMIIISWMNMLYTYVNHMYITIYIHTYSLSIYGLYIEDTASDSYFASISKAGWQVDVEQSLLQTQRRLGLVNAGPPEDCQKDFDALRNKKPWKIQIVEKCWFPKILL